MWAFIAVILISFLISGLWAKYIAATSNEKAEAAAIYDLLLMLASSATYQLWALAHNSFALLVVGDFGAAAGTYVFIRYTKSHRNSSKKPSRQKNRVGWCAKTLNRLLKKVRIG